MNSVPKDVVCEDVEGNKYTVSSDKLTFRPAVYGVIIKDNQVLLSPQWDGYDFPGGGIDLGEDTKNALIREVKEETGFDVKVGEVLHCSNSFFKLPFDGDFVHSIHMYYECEIIGGKISTDLFDEHEKEYAKQAEWIDLSEIRNIKSYCSTNILNVLKKFIG